ncbi:MAG: DUF362 domain-containing protein [Bacteroidales bacterium]|nr:DUF362 domain-containing protein [Bacteroidales bacterium]
MCGSKVYFTNLRTTPKLNLLDKLIALVKKAGIETIQFDKKLTAIKIHFGEPGNLAYIRPNYAIKLGAYLKKLGAMPFLTDANTLYHGRRSNAVDHILAAYENGFNPLVTGCPVIIADGLRGSDMVETRVDMPLCKTAKIAKAVADADIIVSMNHFKGHEMTGFGGALKNLGMGCASVGGKLELHSTSKPKIIDKNCTACKVCERNCAHGAILVGADRIAHINYEKCVGCGQCVAVCQYDSAVVVWDGASEDGAKKIAEYTWAVINNKPSFHINFIMNVSPDCDCWGHNDYPLVPDIGIAASFDPVALDQASADLVSNAPALAGNRICENHKHGDLKGSDKFKLAHPNTFWQAGLEHAEKIGLGSRSYKLIEC